MKFLALFRLLRWQNLLIIALVQYLIRYFLFLPFHVAVSLGDFHFLLMVLATVCLAAAGNIINDIYDLIPTSINRPDRLVIGKALSEKTAFNWFLALNLLGVGIGFYLANYIGQPAFSGFFILPSALLYLYAAHLKRIPLAGNLTVSMLVGLVLLNVAIFDLLPAITPRNIGTQKVIFSIVLDYAIFAFLINLLREVVKDQADLLGDHNAGIPTLPALLGKERTNWLVFLLALFPLTALIYYIYHYLSHSQVAALYVLFLIVAPLLYFLIKILRARSPMDYRQLSRLLKGILIAGVLSIGMYRFILI